MRVWLLMVLGALASGCTTVEAVHGPNGPAYVINCRSHEAECYNKAAEACPNGYEIIGNQSNNVIVPLTTGGSVGATQHSMTVQCKAAPGQTARSNPG
jgi:hypothetical protein